MEDRREHDAVTLELLAELRKQTPSIMGLPSTWLQFVLGGLVAGLVAWGGMKGQVSGTEAEVAALKEHLLASDLRATEDRTLFRVTVDQLSVQIYGLAQAIAAADHSPNPPVKRPLPSFGPQ